MTQAAEEDAGDRINPTVFYGSAVAIVAFALFVMIFTDAANAAIGAALGWISNSFGWFYFIAVVIYLAFVVAVGLSRFGKIRLGPEHSRPEFPLLTWAAMLFAAGIGIDLLFYCVVEPVTQFLAPPEGDPETVAAARHAMQLTFFHWGISGWGIYTLVGMSLAYFSYRHGLPLTIRSALFPIFGNRIEGWIGHLVDIAAVLGTVFGIATSLGIGIIQLTYGLEYMFGIPDNQLTQATLAVAIVAFAALSAATGVERGIRRLSEFNMLLAVLLVLFVLLVGETRFLLNALVMNVGDYVTGFAGMSFNTYAFDPPTDWLNAWTVFFWAWWIAWGPFVGLFLARISRGRTIGQFVAGTLLLPLGFMMVWMSVMGNSAIGMIMEGAAGFGEAAMENPGSSIYLFLETLPWTALTTIATTILAIVFFVTSGDSGSLVLSNFTSVLKDPNSDAPVWMRIVWAVIIGLLTVALLFADGLGALQSTTVIMGLPFSIVLFLVMAGLFKALRVEALKEKSHVHSLSAYLSGRTSPAVHPGAESWAQRLERAVSYPTRREAIDFLRDTARPAMEAIRGELEPKGMGVAIEEETDGDTRLTLRISHEDAEDFVYQLWLRRSMVPSFVPRAQSESAAYYRAEVCLFEGGQGYDVMGYTREQLIDDMLDQYERHLAFLHMQAREVGRTGVLPDDDAAPGKAG
ncbi:choline BCCT transporter BetT [Lutibaculum baratangense]|uniref:High-affinity choline uptake protein BetT n=1 Tax=Lutibaculum baratangense AMV1 TaxID=631454 RepID=V4RHN6_9HYPH|nr:choline BCCT transporter BetT [Lutibaculum baratangense]ESR22780.1 High-affinity choline uptake protein BetT [Lutibaculum baratangense AMV1]